jgi:hypothetical protein
MAPTRRSRGRSANVKWKVNFEIAALVSSTEVTEVDTVRAEFRV